MKSLDLSNNNPVDWVADRLKKFKEEHPKDVRLFSSTALDQYLQSLHASVEVGMEDLAAMTEFGETQMMQSVSRIKTEASGVVLELSTCRSQLKTLLEKLEGVGAEQLSSLATLSEVDALKRRLTMCRNVLSELHQWDVRARELELLLKNLVAEKTALSGDISIPQTAASSSLGQAVSNLVAMKDTVSSLENLPQFEGKLQWVQNYETRLLDACRRRVYNIVENNATNECIQCALVFKRLNRGSDFPNVMTDAFSKIFDAIFEKFWRQTRFVCQRLSIDTSPMHENEYEGKDEDEMLLAYFKEASLKLDQATQLLRAACNSISNMPDEEVETLIKSVQKILTRLLAAPVSDINLLCDQIDEFENNEKLPISVLHALDIGFNIVSATPIVGEMEEKCTQQKRNPQQRGKDIFWQLFCKKSGSDVFPMNLITALKRPYIERVQAVIKDSPLINATWTPTKTITEAESGAIEILRLVSSFQQHDSSSVSSTLDFFIGANVPEVLSSIDHLLEQYWKRWRPLLTLFENTVKSRCSTTPPLSSNNMSQPPPSNQMFPTSLSIDPTVLGPCIQLLRVLATSCQMALHNASNALWKPSLKAWNWPSKLNVASRAAVLQSMKTNSPTNHFATSSSSDTLPHDLLPCALNELLNLIVSSRSTVVFCTVYPLISLLKLYVCQNIWTSPSHSTTSYIDATLPSPTSYATSIGEYLLSAVPYFDDDSSGRHTSSNNEEDRILDFVLRRASDEFVEAVQNIPAFSSAGLRQLHSDSLYLQRAFTALGCENSDIQLVSKIVGELSMKMNGQHVLLDSKNVFKELKEPQRD